MAGKWRLVPRFGCLCDIKDEAGKDIVRGFALLVSERAAVERMIGCRNLIDCEEEPPDGLDQELAQACRKMIREAAARAVERLCPELGIAFDEETAAAVVEIIADELARAGEAAEVRA